MAIVKLKKNLALKNYPDLVTAGFLMRVEGPERFTGFGADEPRPHFRHRKHRSHRVISPVKRACRHLLDPSIQPLASPAGLPDYPGIPRHVKAINPYTKGDWLGWGNRHTP